MTEANVATKSDAKWYIVHTYSNFEKKVSEEIKRQAVIQGLNDLIEEVLVPTEEVIEVRRGQKVNAERKFLPGYVLVRAKLTDMLLDYKIVNEPHDHGSRSKLKEIFGVTGIPSMTDGDVKIADDDDAIIAYLEKTYGAKQSG